jgi:hypothetical protein
MLNAPELTCLSCDCRRYRFARNNRKMQINRLVVWAGTVAGIG